LAENQPLSFAESVRGVRERLEAELRAQAEHILKLSQELSQLQLLHGRTEQEAARVWDAVAQAADAVADHAAAEAASAAAAAASAAAAAEAAATAAAQPKVSPDAALENVLTAVRNVSTCTLPEQLFEALTEEVSRWGVRAAIFDVRGKAAWGASAHGFGPALTERVVHSLIVQLGQDNPFRRVFENADAVEATTESLRKNRNLLDKLKPAPHAPILLLPIRSAGAVYAILYADPGDSGQSIPANGLKILAEFAGAQIDRLIALSGGVAEEVSEEAAADEEEPEPAVEAPVTEAAAPVDAAPLVEAVPAPPVSVEEPPAETLVVEATVPEPVVEPPAPVPVETAPVEVPAEAPAPEPAPAVESETVPQPEAEVTPAPVAEPEPPPAREQAPAPEVVNAPVATEPPPLIEPPTEFVAPPPPVEFPPVEPPPPPPIVEVAPPPPPPTPPAFDLSQLSEAEQKVHKDAKRFARILVSEIELYNKTKVADGRHNRDLYKRLKSDIDRSRQTYEKRFGKVLSKQFDYFHEELIRTLAQEDPGALGPDYPGSTA